MHCEGYEVSNGSVDVFTHKADILKKVKKVDLLQIPRQESSQFLSQLTINQCGRRATQSRLCRSSAGPDCSGFRFVPGKETVAHNQTADSFR